MPRSAIRKARASHAVEQEYARISAELHLAARNRARLRLRAAFLLKDLPLCDDLVRSIGAMVASQRGADASIFGTTIPRSKALQ